MTNAVQSSWRLAMFYTLFLDEAPFIVSFGEEVPFYGRFRGGGPILLAILERRHHFIG